MKGGKRLTEEELSNLIKRAENARRSGHVVVMDAFLKSLIEHLQRDDEPEYCACKNTYFNGERVRLIAGQCIFCGKPVKGE